MAAFTGDKCIVFLKFQNKDPKPQVFYVKAWDRDHNAQE